MTAHKHAKLIKAKADNMELVVFVRVKEDFWQETSSMPTCEDFDYFLCLPKHKESCLHWLNRGKIQYKTDLVEEFQDYQPKIEFGLGSIFMLSNFEIRIKPRKEKRWILINKALNRVCNELFDYQPKDQNGWVSHEIEVEV